MLSRALALLSRTMESRARELPGISLLSCLSIPMNSPLMREVVAMGWRRSSPGRVVGGDKGGLVSVQGPGDVSGLRQLAELLFYRRAEGFGLAKSEEEIRGILLHEKKSATLQGYDPLQPVPCFFQHGGRGVQGADVLLEIPEGDGQLQGFQREPVALLQVGQTVLQVFQVVGHDRRRFVVKAIPAAVAWPDPA